VAARGILLRHCYPDGVQNPYNGIDLQYNSRKAFYEDNFGIRVERFHFAENAHIS